MIQYQISDANMTQAIQSGQLQKTFLDFRIEGGKIQVSENTQFRKEMEENIYNHFNFMQRIAFYHGVFEEIICFIDIYQQQYSQSTQLYEYWKEIDQITQSIELQVNSAKKRIELIQGYNEEPVLMQEFNEFKKQMSYSFLDKDFRMEMVLQNLEDEKTKAEFKADAITTAAQGEIYLKWLQEQKPRQEQFKKELDQIAQSWSDQYKIFEAGRQFIESIDKNQVTIFIQKSWQSENWIQQLQIQIQNTIPFYQKLYEQYLICYKYFLVMSEFRDNVLINKEIKENLIETEIRKAEKPFIEKFLKYYYDQRKQAENQLDTFKSIDLTQHLKQFAKNVNLQLSRMEQAHNDMSITVHHSTRSVRNGNNDYQISYVSGVTLHKKNLNLHYEDPDDVEWAPRTIEQMNLLKEIKNIIQQLEAKLIRLEQLERRYKELLDLPQQIQLKYKQEYEIAFQQGEIKKFQFSLLLKQCELENYDSLTYSQQSMRLLLGALSKNIVIKRNTSCMCASRKQPHNSDDIFYEDYLKVVAQEIRNIKKQENKWFTSNEERILQTTDLPVIKSAMTFILNPIILGALKNDNGSRQIKDRKRDFNPYASMAKTILELCHLVIVDQKQRLNLTSATVNDKVMNWTMSLQNAELGQLARNYSLPINGPQ